MSFVFFFCMTTVETDNGNMYSCKLETDNGNKFPMMFPSWKHVSMETNLYFRNVSSV